MCAVRELDLCDILLSGSITLPASSSAIWVECSLSKAVSLVWSEIKREIHSLSFVSPLFLALLRGLGLCSTGERAGVASPSVVPPSSRVLDRTFRPIANCQK